MNEDISDLSKSLQSKELAIFCGAGISWNSGLPLANELTKHILAKLPIVKKDASEIINSRLPFEAFLEILSENVEISRILDIFKAGEPNTNHFLIAKLAKKGYLRTICTTNFDLLIEKALTNEMLKENTDYVRYYSEEHFSRIDLNNSDNKIQIFKLHGSVDNLDSIRATLKAVASKSLSDKRMNAIRYLFSSGEHKKVLVLGYSCSDKFDITPQIQSIDKNRNEIIFIDHCLTETKDIEVGGLTEPFTKYPGENRKCNTDRFIKVLWDSFSGTIGEYHFKKHTVSWQAYIHNWINEVAIKDGLVLPTSGTLLLTSGALLYFISSLDRANLCFQPALEIFKGTGNTWGEAVVFCNIGNILHDKGHFEAALQYFQDALKLYRELGDKQGEASVLGTIGTIYLDKRDLGNATKYNQNSLKLYRELGDKEGEANQLDNIGVICKIKDDVENAIKHHQDALKIHREFGDKQGEASALGNIGNIYYIKGELEKAAKYHQDALKIYIELGHNLTYNLRKKRELEAILEYFQDALKLARKIGDKQAETTTLDSIIGIYLYKSDLENALKCSKAALKLARKIGDKKGETTALNRFGSVYLHKGDLENAIEYSQAALKLARKIGDKKEETTALNRLGTVYLHKRDMENAIEYSQAALKLARKIGDKKEEASALGNIGNIYLNKDDWDNAMKYLIDAGYI